MICCCSLAGTEACSRCNVRLYYFPEYEYTLPYNIEGILIYPEERSMNTKICGTCEWYKGQLCTFNPQTVKKQSMDSCSHWTAKTLNEVKE